MTSPAITLPKPKNHADFERMCLALFREKLCDPSAKLFGVSGQKQMGIDILGRRGGNSTGLVGIQCKSRNGSKGLSPKEVTAEYEKAARFKPALCEFFVLTTSRDDAELDQLAAKLSNDSRQTDHPLEVHVWGWDTIEQELLEYPAALKAFDLVHSPFAEEMMNSVRERVALLDTKLSSTFHGRFDQVVEQLSSLASQVGPMAQDPGPASDGAQVAIEGEIDDIVELITNGQCQTARGMLERLQERVLDEAGDRIKFRIQSNIAACNYAEGKRSIAARQYLQAANLAPEEPKAASNKVLGLLLLDRMPEASEFGQAQLSEQPSNAPLAGYTLQAIAHCPDIDDGPSLIPEEVKGSVEYRLGQIYYFHQRGRTSEWLSCIEQAATEFPEDEQVRQLAATAKLQQIYDKPRYRSSQCLDEEDALAIVEVTKALNVAYRKALESEGPLNNFQEAACRNYIASLWKAGGLDQAKEAALTCIERAPDSESIAEISSMIGVELNDQKLVNHGIKTVKHSIFSLQLQLQAHCTTGEWSDIRTLFNDHAESLPTDERIMAELGARIADLEDSRELSEVDLRRLAKLVEGNARSTVMLANYSATRAHMEFARELLASAESKIDDQSPLADTLMVAMLASNFHMWSTVTRLLDGKVSENSDTAELRCLATAFVNERPPTTRAAEFFKRLPESIARTPAYAAAYGMFQFNIGELGHAKELLRLSMNSEPEASVAFALVVALIRTESRSVASEYINSLSPASLPGSSQRRIGLAAMLADFGEPEKALYELWEIMSAAEADADAVLAYVGVMFSKRIPEKCLEIERVGGNCWAQLTSDFGDTFEFYLVDSNDPTKSWFTDSHPLVRQALGLSLGESFTQKSPMEGEIVWRVAALKHRCLHLLHHHMETFESRFPGRGGMFRVRTRGDDIEPVLKQIRRHEESVQENVDRYITKAMPMCFLGPTANGEALGFAETLLDSGHDIRTSIGLKEEQDSAYSLISSKRDRGVVLDLYTAWVVAENNLFDLLLKVFGRVCVPRSAIDLLHVLSEDRKFHRGDGMTLSYRRGEYIRREFSAAESDNRINLILQRLNEIQSNAEVVTSLAPDNLDARVRDFLCRHGAHGFDAAFAANGEMLLLSDDANYRSWAQALIQVDGIWLQVVAMYARQEGLIDWDRYHDVVVALGRRNHRFLAVTAKDLIYALRLAENGDWYSFQSVARSLGGAQADWGKNLIVAAAFLARIWNAGEPKELVHKRATAYVMRRMTTGRDVAVACWAILVLVNSASLFRYVFGWSEWNPIRSD